MCMFARVLYLTLLIIFIIPDIQTGTHTNNSTTDGHSYRQLYVWQLPSTADSANDSNSHNTQYKTTYKSINAG